MKAPKQWLNPLCHHAYIIWLPCSAPYFQAEFLYCCLLSRKFYTERTCTNTCTMVDYTFVIISVICFKARHWAFGQTCLCYFNCFLSHVYLLREMSHLTVLCFIWKPSYYFPVGLTRVLTSSTMMELLSQSKSLLLSQITALMRSTPSEVFYWVWQVAGTGTVLSLGEWQWKSTPWLTCKSSWCARTGRQAHN